jgi:hypothetical protein
MKRVHLNFGIDLAAFLALLMLVSTGLLIEFRLPPGSGGHEPYGHGRRAMERATPVIWDLTRHQWGAIHFWIALSFVALLTVHLVLHWKWIAATCKNLVPRAAPFTVLVWLIAILAMVLIAAPLLSPKTERIRVRSSLVTPAVEQSTLEGQTAAAIWVGSMLPDSKRFR